jgi:hypothetical protein
VKQQISIPKPCNENWDLMTPKDQGRFCDKCTKVFMDFSAMSNEEIIAYLEKQKEEVCGRIKTNQFAQSTTSSKKLKRFLYAFALVFLPFIPLSSFGQDVQPKETLVKKSIAHEYGAIVGRILNSTGDSSSKLFRIELLSDGKVIAETNANDHGNFKTKPLEPGYYRIRYSTQNCKPTITKKIQVLSYRSTTAPLCELNVVEGKLELSIKESIIYEIKGNKPLKPLDCTVGFIEAQPLPPNWYEITEKMNNFDIEK